ncbi:MAG: hypothetical protein AB9834_07660 [Lentimicrobium sp.]
MSRSAAVGELVCPDARATRRAIHRTIFEPDPSAQPPEKVVFMLIAATIFRTYFCGGSESGFHSGFVELSLYSSPNSIVGLIKNK